MEIQRTPMSDFGCLCFGNCNQYLIKQKYKFYIKKSTGYWFLKQLLAPCFQVWKNKVSLSFVVTWAEALATPLWQPIICKDFWGLAPKKHLYHPNSLQVQHGIFLFFSAQHQFYHFKHPDYSGYCYCIQKLQWNN